MNRTRLFSLVFLVTGFSFLFDAQADPRRFAYSYETLTYVPGSFELETWMTYKHGDSPDRYDFRHEIEYGVSERLRLGFYFADWRYDQAEGTSFHDVGLEAIYNLTNPNTDWLGSSLYGEIKGGKDLLELEGKLLLQKNLGPFALVYNLILEAEWEEEGLSESKGEFAQTAGVSYLVSPAFGVGVELLDEVEIHDWEDFEDHAFYFGPNATFRKNDFWVTLAGLWELTDTGEPNFQLRTLCGLHF